MKRLSNILMLCLVATTAAASTLPEVDRYLASKIRDHRVPGLALVVVRNGEVVHRRGFGELDPTRPIIIGSLSKAITATAVLRLVEQGRIVLDEPMVSYLPDVRFADAAVRRVTVRQLLNQTSGLPADAARAREANATLDQHVAALADVRLVAEPGAQHIYSSPNYQLLGRIIEVVSGRSFGDFVQAEVFKTLEMTSSFTRKAEALAPGHNLWWGFPGPSPYSWESGRLPTASLISSADDLAKFVRSHLGVGPQLLSPGSTALAHRGAGKAESFSYAMGWREGTTAGVPSLWHGGAVPSYRGAIVMIPHSRSAVIVLTNSSSMFADHTREIAAGVVALLEKRPVPQGVRPLKVTYSVVLTASLVLLALGVRSLVRAIRGVGAAPRTTSVLAFDIALPLVLVALGPRLAHVSFRAMWEGAPDVAVTVMVVLLFGFVTAAFKLRHARTGSA